MISTITPPACVDVLILGAGLAGLRAALSCLRADPGLSVLVAGLRPGPSGSSFANANDALGMHAPRTQQEQDDYRQEARALAGGGFLNPELVDVQAREAGDRLRDLTDLGFPFQRNPDGTLTGRGSCFSPDSRRAYVFEGLSKAWACMMEPLSALGCRFAFGVKPVALVMGERRGAVLACGEGETLATVGARVVVAAVGGPAGLFRHAGPGAGVPGYADGLLARTGAAMANCGHLQFLWASLPERSFVQPGDLPGDVFGFDPELARQRRGHCPAAHGLPDAALDHALCARMDPDGIVRTHGRQMVPLTHAGNGGAVIDAQAQTDVPGLLACGECATGMHGANRLGGAMVLATQVFGHRAGERAAALCRETGPPRPISWARPLVRDRREREEGLARLGLALSRHAAPLDPEAARPGRQRALDALRVDIRDAEDWQLRLSLATAELILAAQLEPGP